MEKFFWIFFTSNTKKHKIDIRSYANAPQHMHKAGSVYNTFDIVKLWITHITKQQE